MAQGTLALFDEFAESIGDGRIDLDTDTFKVAFVTLQVGGTPSIAKTDAIPTWGAGGSTNLSSSEVTPGGGYTVGGDALASVTWGQTAGVATFDADPNVWTSSAGSPATIKTAVIYSDTAANKDCIGFVDMTADGTTAISLLAGDVTITWGVGGILTATNP
jgi:hypothetical protein